MRMAYCMVALAGILAACGGEDADGPRCEVEVSRDTWDVPLTGAFSAAPAGEFRDALSGQVFSIEVPDSDADAGSGSDSLSSLVVELERGRDLEQRRLQCPRGGGVAAKNIPFIPFETFLVDASLDVENQDGSEASLERTIRFERPETSSWFGGLSVLDATGVPDFSLRFEERSSVGVAYRLSIDGREDDVTGSFEVE